MVPVGGACGMAMEVGVDVEDELVRATNVLVILGEVVAGAMVI
jgi:hypothetical protein